MSSPTAGLETSSGTTDPAIAGLEPAAVWQHFAALTRIPRGSGEEKAAAAFVIGHARRLGLTWKQDRTGNVVVSKPASSGRESAPRVCLQGHLDMVNEKRPDVRHDFDNDPIRLVRRGDKLMADGTTLGADNGVAVATNLALMDDTSLRHGPLEFLFTVDEERGLSGANGLEPGFVQSRTLINLDSEEEGSLFVGCSGGRDSTGTWTIERDQAPAGAVALEVTVGGLRGGHSGLEIDKGRGNAVRILARALQSLDAIGARIARIDGGNKRNAIPRDASAVVFVARAREAEARDQVAALDAAVRAEFKTVEPDVRLTIAPGKARGGVFKRALQKRLLLTLLGLPHGVTRMSADIPGLVETSTNLAMIATGPRSVKVDTSQRSSVQSEIDEVVDQVRAVFTLGGAAVTGSNGYPGWKPNLDSPILQSAIAAYRDRFGREPEVKSIHAGLECGIIGDKYPGIDMVSFGPTLEGVHSPDEAIHIASVAKYWEFLRALLENV
jgi:dipeptidase D